MFYAIVTLHGRTQLIGEQWVFVDTETASARQLAQEFVAAQFPAAEWQGGVNWSKAYVGAGLVAEIAEGRVGAA